MKKIIILVMVLGIASRVSAAQTSSPAATDSAVTVGVTLYSPQEAATYFNNSFWVRAFSKLNRLVSRNVEHHQKLCDMHQAIMPVKIVVTNKSDKPVYLPVNNWVKGVDAAYNTASIAAAYGQPWTGFAASGLLILVGADGLINHSCRTVVGRPGDDDDDRAMAPLRIVPNYSTITGATAFLAFGAYMAYKLWKAQSTSTVLRTLQPRIVHTVNGKRVETQVDVKTVRDTSFYELPAKSSFEALLFIPRVGNNAVNVGVDGRKTLPAA